MSAPLRSGSVAARPVLDGVLVVEFGGGVAGSAAGMLLADYGARVLKLEPPEGSPLRSAPVFQVLNRGKESVVVDAASEHDRARVREMLAACDVCLVADLDLWRSLGLDQESVGADNPGMTLVMMPPYVDENDRWPEDGEALSAALGMAINQCSFEGVPVEIVEPHLLYVQGALGALAAVCGLRETDLSGRGRSMTVSGAHAFVAFAPQLLVFDPTTAVRKRDLGAGGAHPLYTNYQAADGRWIFLGALSDKFMRRALAVLEDETLLDDPRIGGDTDGLYSPVNRRWVRARLAERFRARASTEWLRLFESVDVPVAPVQTCREWWDHPQFEASCGRVVVRHPVLGSVEMPRRFFRLPAAPEPDPGAAPELGSSGPEVDRSRIAGPGERSRGDVDPAGPLGGLRVAILGSFVAGPQTARLLHLMGADVIKVEPPAGDPWRRYGFQFSEGVRSLAVDLRTPEGLAALIRLAETLDVVIDNFRPGFLRSIGADDDALRAAKPDIVTTSLTGFGESGPLASRPGFDPVLGALSGMQEAQGGDAEPVVMSLAVNDTCGAVLAALATVLAVFHQQRTGIGQHVECSLAGASAYLQLDSLLRYPGRPPPPRGGRDYPGRSPWRRYYLAADGWLRLDGSASPGTVRRRAGVDGDDRAATESLAGWIRERTVDDVVDAFAGTPVRVLHADNARQAVLNERYMAVPLAHLVHPPGVERPFYTASHVAAITGQRTRAPGVVPGIGEQSADILGEAGLSRDEIDGLVAGGRVRQGEPYVPVVLEPYR